jgi:hypothetical protein
LRERRRFVNEENSSPLPNNGEEWTTLLLPLLCCTFRADDHFLDDFLTGAAGIIRVVHLALVVLVGANKCVRHRTIWVLFAASFHAKAFVWSTGRSNRLTQLTAKHGNEPIIGHSGWLMARTFCNQIRGCYGADDSENRQANSPENRAEGEALSLREVPKKKPEAGQGAGAVVLPELSEPPVQIKSAMTGRCGEPTSGPIRQPVHVQPFPASTWSMRTLVRAP